jgi:hypothetical protein
VQGKHDLQDFYKSTVSLWLMWLVWLKPNLYTASSASTGDRGSIVEAENKEWAGVVACWLLVARWQGLRRVQ